MALNTIQVRGDYERYEALAGAAITPGMLVALNSASKVVVHPTAGGAAEKAFAVEDALQGSTIADAYAADDLVQYNIQKSGNIVQALINDGEVIVVGDKLVSAGNGYLAKMTGDSSAVIVEQFPVAIAMEAVSLDDSSTADPSARIKVRII